MRKLEYLWLQEKFGRYRPVALTASYPKFGGHLLVTRNLLTALVQLVRKRWKSDSLPKFQCSALGKLGAPFQRYQIDLTFPRNGCLNNLNSRFIIKFLWFVRKQCWAIRRSVKVLFPMSPQPPNARVTWTWRDLISQITYFLWSLTYEFKLSTEYQSMVGRPLHWCHSCNCFLT